MGSRSCSDLLRCSPWPFVRLDTHLETGDFTALLSQSGLPIFDTVLTMSLGKRLATFAPADGAPFVTYGLASPTLG
jgi:hypothetical protein